MIKYVMALMNGARLGIAAQSVGLSQAAYNEGDLAVQLRQCLAVVLGQKIRMDGERRSSSRCRGRDAGLRP